MEKPTSLRPAVALSLALVVLVLLVAVALLVDGQTAQHVGLALGAAGPFVAVVVAAFRSD